MPKLAQLKTIFIIVALLTGSLALSGYVDPYPLQLHRLSTHAAVWSSLNLKGQRTQVDSASGSTLTESLNLTLTRPDRVALVGNEAGQTPTAIPSPLRQALNLLMLAADKPALHKRIGQLGIATGTIGLGRIGRTVCVIVGAGEHQTKLPQIWIDKDRHHLARVILPLVAGNADAFAEITFSDWDFPGTGGRFPHTVTLRVGETRIEHWVIETAQPNTGRRP